MNRFLQYSLSLLIASTTCLSLNGMMQKQERSIIEILCCLHHHGIYRDIDPLLTKPIILMHIDADRNHIQSLDTMTPQELCASLLKYCDRWPRLNAHLMPYAELGAMLASHCALKGCSLEGFVDSKNRTILHYFGYADPYDDYGRFSPTTIINALATILAAVGNKAQHLVMVQDNDYGHTALHTAVWDRNRTIVSELLTTPTINAQELAMVQDNNGETALHWAVNVVQPEIVKVLLTTPCINAHQFAQKKDKHGLTAFICAHFTDQNSKSARESIVAMLKPFMHQEIKAQCNIINDILCCLQARAIPADIDPSLMKPVIMRLVQHCLENTLEIQNSTNLFFSFIPIIDNLSQFGKMTPSEQELGAILAAHLAVHGTSLLGIARGDNNPDTDELTILELLAIFCYNNGTLVNIFLAAAGPDAHQLALSNAARALQKAAALGNTNVVQALLHHPSINAHQLAMTEDYKGYTALRCAFRSGSNDVVKAILNAPRVDIRQLLLTPNRRNQSTAWEYANGIVDDTIMQTLLSARINAGID